MVTTLISPLPLQHFVDGNGNALTGGKLFTYAAGTTTKQNTYTDATGATPNANPVILNSRGEAQVWLDSTKSYKFVLSPATDSDPPTNAIWTVDSLNGNLGGALGFGTQTSLASNTTTDLGTVASNNVLVTGSTTITSFGSSAVTTAPVFLVEFNAALTLTYNGTSLVIPGSQSITTAQGDTALCLYLGSGNWRVLTYQRANGQAISMTGAEATLASTATTDLGSTGVNLVKITGTTTITSLGSSASQANPVYLVRFTGILTLTYNASSLILPNAVNKVTAANDSAIFEYLGAGNWMCLSYFTSGSGGGGASSTIIGGSYRNLKCSYAGGNKQGTITADAILVATASDAAAFAIESLSVTLDISTNGAVNKLDAGTAANNTLYFLFAISNTTTSGVLASLSSSAPTMPSGYTYKTRIGAFFTDGSANIIAGNQLGRTFRYSTPKNIANGAVGTATASSFTAVTQSISAQIPSTAAKFTVIAQNTYNGAGTTAIVYVAPNANYNASNSANVPAPLFLNTPGSGVGTFGVAQADFVYESANISWASSTAGGAIWAAGWEDNI